MEIYLGEKCKETTCCKGDFSISYSEFILETLENTALQNICKFF